MTFSHYSLITWLCRLLLIILCLTMSYIVLLPQYNFSHLIPHNFIRGLGVPYELRLQFEQHSDKIFHFTGALGLTILLDRSEIYFKNLAFKRLSLTIIIVGGMIIAAEIAQFKIGRGFSRLDIFMGLSGLLIAALFLFKRQSNRSRNKP